MEHPKDTSLYRAILKINGKAKDNVPTFCIREFIARDVETLNKKVVEIFDADPGIRMVEISILLLR